MESQFIVNQNGQQVETGDFGILGQTSALADDRVLAELLRLVPYNGSSVAKAILPYRDSSSNNGATVQPGIGGVEVFPFRAIVGTQSSDEDNGIDFWRDIRSCVFANSDASPLSFHVSLTSGTPITGGDSVWALIYATITPAALGPAVNRFVKDPTTKVVSTSTTNVVIQPTVTVSAIFGTEGTSPTFPATPSDAAGNFYIPLAYVYIPFGFSGTTVVGSRDIYDTAPTVYAGTAFGLASAGPSDGQYLPTGPVQTGFEAWAIASNGRPAAYMPPTMIGKQDLYIALDLTNADSTKWSHVEGSVIDSRDWSNRIFKWTAYASQLATDFAWNAGSSSRVVPNARVQNADAGGSNEMAPVAGFGQSFVVDIVTGTNVLGDATTSAVTGLSQPAVVAIDGTLNINSGASPAPIAASTAIAVYCDLSDGGKLKLHAVGNPQARIFIWLEASAPFPNH